jgi:SAM-dependent MidA family methyltransferase
MTAPTRDDTGEPALVDLIRAEIESKGPMTFARFMERALYEPGLGYYATSGDRATRDGDFLTAPELHPIFGRALARQVDEMWSRLGSPSDFVLREFGAGTGALGASIRDGMARDSSPLAAALHYEPVEIEGRIAVGLPSGSMVGCVLGNELLDALPVHRVVRQGGELCELYVGWMDARFVHVAGELSDQRLRDRLERDPVALPEGHHAEICLAMTDWLGEVAREFERGYVLLIDYALPQADLRSERRATGTLRAFRGHHVSSDVLSGVGRQDTTAHVDLDALEMEAEMAGFDVLGRTTQSQFLMGCGLDEIYQAARAEADQDWDSALLLRSALRRMLDPLHLGAYAVVILGKNVDGEPPLRGLAYQVQRPT